MTKNLLILTDLDGTLLDKKTLQPGPANKYLQLCTELNIPVVFVSAKTRAEIELLRIELNNRSPFISENGGGLYIHVIDFPNLQNFHRDGPYWYWCAKESIDELREGLKKAAQKSNVEVKSFNRMTVKNVSSLTGLNLHQAELAKMRNHDEPFIIIDEDTAKLSSLRNEIEKQGYRYTSGGYLHHITGDFDKGKAVKLLMDVYRNLNPDIKFAGIGDGPNDRPLLKIADYPFLVRKPDNSYDTEIVFDGLTVTKGIGPYGFAEAVESLISQ